MASDSKSTDKLRTLDQLKKEVVKILRSCDGHCLDISKFKSEYKQKFGRTFEKYYSALLKGKKFSSFMAALDIIELQKSNENQSIILMKLKESNSCELKSSSSGTSCQQERSDSNDATARLEKSPSKGLPNVASKVAISLGAKDEIQPNKIDTSLVKSAASATVSPLLLPTPLLPIPSVLSKGAQLPRTQAQKTNPSSGSPQVTPLSLFEIMKQQAQEEMQLAIRGSPSPHTSYDRLLQDMSTPSPAKRELLFSPPDHQETRLREVGTPGPFEESISHAHDAMNSITSKGKSVRNATFREINKAAEEIITSLSKKDRFVGLEEVKAALCNEFGKTSLTALGFKKERDIPALKDLIEMQAKVNLFVHAYVMSNSISTLYELNQSLADLGSKSDFEELNLGPLLKQPVVYDMFKAPQGLSQVPHVTTIQILKHLEKYMTKEDLWRKKVDLGKFMEYLSEEYQCGTPFDLGVRIQSIGLAISVIKKAKHNESEKWKGIREQVSADMDEEIERHLRKIKRDLLGQDLGDSRSCVKKFLDTSPTDALTAVFDCCLETFEDSRAKKITKFLETVTKDSHGRHVFQLALYMSCKRLLGDALENMVDERVKKELETANNLASRTETETGSDPPSEGIIVEEVNEWLNKAERTDLATLARIEENVMNRYSGFDGFEAFGYGSFLKFLTKHKVLRETIAEVGGIAPSGNGGTGLGLRVSLDSVLNFISQCGTEPTPESIEQYLCDYYNVNKVTDLGFGSAANLVKKAAERKKNLVGANISSIVYEAALLRHSSGVGDTDSTSVSTRSGGVLGFKSKEEALEAIKSTPLLEDVSLWTHWDEVFGGEVSKLGDLKSFLENEGILLSTRKTSSQSQNPLVVMETSPGVLLRVTMDTSPDMFRECTRHRDVIGATGHLVSMVVMNGGVSNTPVALLANHVQSSLASMVVDDRGDSDHRSTFVLKCLTRMPLRLAQAVGAKVFFEPLKKLVGSTEAASLLLRSCFTQSQRGRLHLLGFALGIGEWRDDFLSRVACKREEDEGLVSGGYSDDEQKRPIAVVKPVAAHVSSTLQTETSTESEPEGDVAVSKDQKNFAEKAGDEVTSSTQDEFPEVPPTPCAPPRQQEDECKAVIDQIRRDDFGIGIELGEEESKLVQRQREREGRGLARLSSELYSRDTHFVLELVQNADDNSYPEVCSDPGFPSLLFVLERDRIVILNNEIGFEEKNIRALCDVGRSTKGKHRYGYIGQKGIGFKSVFRVTDCPEVHSNGYHIRFDAKSGPIGYILPEWIGGNCSEERAMEDLGDESVDDEKGDNGSGASSSGDEFSVWPTCIVLPLNDEHRQNEKSSLAPRFHDIRPSLLLFLHRLRGIFIHDKVHNSRSEMIRKDLGDNIMEIKHTKGTDRWLVIKKQLDASNMKEDVEMTELALAFPLFDDSGSTSSQRIRHQNLPPQNVFAYLPLRSYGFRFIIQGDFEVPSSREDVDSDKSWNQWLREEIPQLFIDALSVFMVHPSFSGLSSVVSYFQFVPLEEEILDFFSPVARHILKLLQSKCCIPVIVSSNETEVPAEVDDRKSYNWVLPTEAIFSEDSIIQKLITPALLKEHLGLSYLHPEIVPALNPTLRSRLGIETLSSRHLMDIGRAEVKKASNESDEAASHSKDYKLDVVKIGWVARWLQCMYRCLEQERNSSQEMLDRIRSLKVIPLTDGTFVNLKEDSVFLPLSLQKISEGAIPKAKKGSKSQEQTTFSVLEKDLSTVHPSLFSSLDDIGRSQVEQLLRSLGVKVWSPKELVNSHIIPTFKSDKWKSKSNEVFRSYLVYILEERLKDPSVYDMDELKSCVQILTNKGVLNPTTTSIHFTPKYGSTIDLAGRLPSISWTLIDESYLDCYTGLKACSTDWKEFLTKLGVKHFLSIKRKPVRIHRDTMAKTPWTSYENIWQTTPDGFYIINDWACEQFEEFLRKIDSTDAKQRISPEESTFLAQCIDERWGDEYAQYAEEFVHVEDTNGHNLKETRSSFYLNLVTKPWMASTAGGKDFHLPRDLFVRSELVYRLLENHVNYVAADLKSSSFIETLRIRENVGVDGLINEMKKWSGCGCERMDGNQRKEFTTSVAHMSRVYFFLLEKMNQSGVERMKIHEAFLKNEMIFVPHRPPSLQSAGFFYLKKDVCWTDPTEVSRKLLEEQDKMTTRPLLEMFYRSRSTQESLSAFFVDHIGVDATPNVGEYIEMASTVAEVSRFPSPSSLRDMLQIFATFGSKCVGRDHKNRMRLDQQIDANMTAFLKQSLQDDQIRIFPTTDKWVALSEKPLIADDKSLLKIFQKEKSVHFLDFGDFYQPQNRRSSKNKPQEDHELMKHYVSSFLNSCGVATLSKCVKKEFTPGGAVQYQCVPLQKHFHQLIPCVQRFLYSRYQSVYNELSSQGFAQKLPQMQFASVPSLATVYSLSTHPDVHVPLEEKSGIQEAGGMFCLYVVQEYQDNLEVLNAEMIKLLFGGKKPGASDLNNFLVAVKNYSGNDLDSYLEDKQDLEPLPEDEERWIVPSPEVPEIVMDDSEEAMNEAVPFHKETATPSRSGDDGLHSWPPKSSAQYDKACKREGDPGGEPILKIWPLPEPPETVEKPFREENQDYLVQRPTQRDINTTRAPEAMSENPLKGEDRKPALDYPGAVVPRQQRTENDAQQPPEVIVEDALVNNQQISSRETASDLWPNEIENRQHNTKIVEPPPPQVPLPGEMTFVTIPGDVARQTSPSRSNLWFDGGPSEVEFEDLQFNDNQRILERIPLLDNPNKEDIGRWGEQCVFEFLQEQARGHSPGLVEIVWINENGNTTAPYDIEIRQHISGVKESDKRTVVTFVEVKTTSSDQKDSFELSVPELQFALKHQVAFHLYRVFNAGKPDIVRIRRLQNLATHLEKKTVKLCMVI